MYPLSAVFQQVLSMSLTASLVIAVLCILRLCLKKAPKKFSYWLWAAAAFRLVCPVSFSAVFSLFSHSSMETVRNVGPLTSVSYLPSAVSAVREFLTASHSGQTAPGAAASPPTAAAAQGAAPVVDPIAGSGGPILQILSLVWALGVLVLLTAAALSYVRTRRRVRTAVKLYGNVYECGAIRSPFVLGFFRPRIYLPFGLDAAQKDAVLCHESVHLRRKDHLVKPLAFLILTAHWFNPLVWLAFHLMAKDMEMSCDERVLELAGEDVRRSYSLSLLSFAENRRFPSPNPLAFGETGVKDRVKNVMAFRKAKVWVSVAAAAACVLVAAACSVNPSAEGGASVPPPEAPPVPSAPSAPAMPDVTPTPGPPEAPAEDTLDLRTREVLRLLFTCPEGELATILEAAALSPSSAKSSSTPSLGAAVVGGPDGPTQIYFSDSELEEKIGSYFRERFPAEYFYEYGYEEFLKALTSQWGFYLGTGEGRQLQLGRAERGADGENDQRRWTASVNAILPDGTFRTFPVSVLVTGSQDKIESFWMDDPTWEVQTFLMESTYEDQLIGGAQDQVDEHTLEVLNTLFDVPNPDVVQMLRDMGYPGGRVVRISPSPLPDIQPSPTVPPPPGSLTPLEDEDAASLSSGGPDEANRFFTDAFSSYYAQHFPAGYFTEDGLKNLPVFAQDWDLFETCFLNDLHTRLYAARRVEDDTTAVRQWELRIRLTAWDHSTTDATLTAKVQEKDGKIVSLRLSEEADSLRDLLQQVPDSFPDDHSYSPSPQPIRDAD